MLHVLTYRSFSPPLLHVRLFPLRFIPLRCKTTQTAIFIEEIRTFFLIKKNCEIWVERWNQTFLEISSTLLEFASPKHLSATCWYRCGGGWDTRTNNKIIISTKAFSISFSRLSLESMRRGNRTKVSHESFLSFNNKRKVFISKSSWRSVAFERSIKIQLSLLPDCGNAMIRWCH